MSKHLTPARVCERQFGGPAGVAMILGIGEKAPYGWHHASKNRDAGDLPSSRHMRALLDDAAARGIVLDPLWLIAGADEDAIRAAEAQRDAMSAAHVRVATAGAGRVEAAE